MPAQEPFKILASPQSILVVQRSNAFRPTTTRIPVWIVTLLAFQ